MAKYILSFIFGLTLIVMPQISETPSIIDATNKSIVRIVNAKSISDLENNNGNDKQINLLPIVPNIYKVWVTAYSSDPKQTDNTPFTTASNIRVRDGIVAANFLPFGTQIKIPAIFGEKIFTVEDRMHKRKKNFIDIWMPNKKDAVNFGINHTEIFVVN